MLEALGRICRRNGELGVAIQQTIVGRGESPNGYYELTLSYDDVTQRVTAVSYINTSPVPAYLEIRGTTVLRYDLPANTPLTTKNIPSGNRPLLDVGMAMGWAPA